MPTKRKVGKFSLDDLAYIDANIGVLTVEQMAVELNRSVEVIQKHLEEIKDKKNSTITKQGQLKATEELRAKPFWKHIKEQYNDAELDLYQHHWAEYLEQFDYDVTASEENQICKFIDLDLLMNRVKREMYRTTQEVMLIERVLADEMNKDTSMQDKNFIQTTMATLQGYRASQNSRTKEFNELLNRHSQMARDLKTTRDQRFKDIQERKVTFHGLLKSFRDTRNRTTMSKEAELIKLAMKEMSAYHQYADGILDQPILSSETLKQDNE
jgi:hypothetical protein